MHLAHLVGLAEQGHVRIYLDGAKEPAVDLPFKGYFDGKNEPFTRSALVHTVAMGWNNYTPDPLPEVVQDRRRGGLGTVFPVRLHDVPQEARSLPTFKRQLSAEENAALDEANKILSKGGPAPAGLPECGDYAVLRRTEEVIGEVIKKVIGKTAVERPTDAITGQITLTIERGTGSRRRWRGRTPITGLGVSGKFENREDEIEALRDIVLQITWDDEDKPAVWSPLGDFFGTAPGVNLYRSFPLGMTEEGYYCNWYMPFATSATFEFINEGTKPRTLDLWVTIEPLRGPSSNSAGSTPSGTATPSCRRSRSAAQIDWTMLKTAGPRAGSAA